MYASCCCLVANTHPNMTLKHNIYFEEVSRQGVVDRNFSFSSHAETHPGSGREKCVGEEWCPSGLVWPHVGLAGTGHGIATLPGRLLFPCGPCGLLPTSSTSGPVLWALFPITPTPLIQCCLPRDGEAESQQRFCRKEWRGAKMQRLRVQMPMRKTMLCPCFLSFFLVEGLWTQWTLQTWPSPTSCGLPWGALLPSATWSGNRRQ